jgi:hypothetical protein
MASSDNTAAPSGAAVARFEPMEDTMKWSKKVYDAMVAEVDLDKICVDLAAACQQKAAATRAAGDDVLAQAWEQDGQQFITLADRFSAGDFYKIEEDQKR